jgi:hypothetical protein
MEGGVWLGVAMKRGGGVRWRDARAVRCQRRQVPRSAGGGLVFVPGENRGWWGKEGPGRVGHYGPAGVGRPETNNGIFHLIRIFKVTQICNGSKHTFPCSKNSK